MLHTDCFEQRQLLCTQAYLMRILWPPHGAAGGAVLQSSAVHIKAMIKGCCKLHFDFRLHQVIAITSSDDVDFQRNLRLKTSSHVNALLTRPVTRVLSAIGSQEGSFHCKVRSSCFT